MLVLCLARRNEEKGNPGADTSKSDLVLGQECRVAIGMYLEAPGTMAVFRDTGKATYFKGL